MSEASLKKGVSRLKEPITNNLPSLGKMLLFRPPTPSLGFAACPKARTKGEEMYDQLLLFRPPTPSLGFAACPKGEEMYDQLLLFRPPTP